MVAAREDVDEVLRKISSGEAGSMDQMRRDQSSMAEQLEAMQAELLLKVEKVGHCYDAATTNSTNYCNTIMHVLITAVVSAPVATAVCTTLALG
jgi:hypothetical protein